MYQRTPRQCANRLTATDAEDRAEWRRHMHDACSRRGMQQNADLRFQPENGKVNYDVRIFMQFVVESTFYLLMQQLLRTKNN